MNSLKYELNVLGESIFKILPYLIIIFIITCIQFYMDLLLFGNLGIDMKNVYCNLLGIFVSKDYIPLTFISHILLSLYLCFYYMTYELNNSAHFIYLRIDKNKLYLIKCIIINSFILLFRIVVTFSIYIIFFKEDFVFNSHFFIWSILVYFLVILVNSISISIYNIKKVL